jgi:hypothetical protein
MRKVPILVAVMAVSVWLLMITYVSAANVGPASDGQVPGQPFQYLQQQIDALKAQADAIQPSGGAIKVYDADNNYLGIYAGLAPGNGTTTASIFVPSLKLFVAIEDNCSSPDYGDVRREGYYLNATGEVYLRNAMRLVRVCDGSLVTGVGDSVPITTSRFYNPDCSFTDFKLNTRVFGVQEIDQDGLPFTLPVAMPLRYE